ncbi:MAG TPA: MFS transporter, partial [Saliniramus sp.]|nr:MFS transporter [Saliniramus sp.]
MRSSTDAAWRQGAYFASPIAFLMTLAFINYIGFASWQALLNNFAKEEAGFTGFEIGVLQSVREIPGFLAFTAIFLFMLMREQMLAYLSLLTLGVGVALTGLFPSFYGLLITTMIMSIGFHYFETANQALSLQLLSKKEAPGGLGKIHGANAAAQLIAYGGIAAVYFLMEPS